MNNRPTFLHSRIHVRTRTHARTHDRTHNVDTVQWSPWTESELVVGFSSWQDIFAYDVAACKGSVPTRMFHNKNKNVGVCDLAFNKPR